MYLSHFLHQIIFGVQPTGRIDDNHISTTLIGGSQRIEDDSSGASPLFVGYNICSEALAPLLKLVDGRSSECIGCGEDNLLSLISVDVG